MTLSVLSDDHFMKEALKEAEKALEEKELPVGAVVTCNKTVVARAHHQVEQLKDSTAHAEMIALTAAMQYLGSQHLPDCTLYTTLEPCPMCAGATRLAQIDRVVYGTGNGENGFTKVDGSLLHPDTELTGDTLQPQCAELMMDYHSRQQAKKN